MTVLEQLRGCQQFFHNCVSLMKRGKAEDYAPEGAIFLDVFAAAADLGVTPEEILLVHIRKQLTAVRRWVRYGTLTSEGAESRLLDLGNYIAFLDLFREHGNEIASGVIQVLQREVCTVENTTEGQCVSGLDDECDRCKTLRHTTRYQAYWPRPMPRS
jgi:hypothetical protein